MILLALVVLMSKPVLEFDVSAGPADAAILDWSHQSHLQVLFDWHAVHGARAVAVKGQWEPLEALRRMLRYTGLKADYTTDRAVAVTEPVRYCHPEYGADAPLPPCVQKPLQVRPPSPEQ